MGIYIFLKQYNSHEARVKEYGRVGQMILQQLLENSLISSVTDISVFDGDASEMLGGDKVASGLKPGELEVSLPRLLLVKDKIEDDGYTYSIAVECTSDVYKPNYPASIVISNHTRTIYGDVYVDFYDNGALLEDAEKRASFSDKLEGFIKFLQGVSSYKKVFVGETADVVYDFTGALAFHYKDDDDFFEDFLSLFNKELNPKDLACAEHNKALQSYLEKVQDYLRPYNLKFAVESIQGATDFKNSLYDYFKTKGISVSTGSVYFMNKDMPKDAMKEAFERVVASMPGVLKDLGDSSEVRGRFVDALNKLKIRDEPLGALDKFA
jgi:hypothetical protein